MSEGTGQEQWRGYDFTIEEILDFATSFNISEIYMFGLVGRHGYALQLK